MSQLLTPGEVARRLQVDPKTVTRWADAGRLACVRLPSGHRRFRAADIEAIETQLNGEDYGPLSELEKIEAKLAETKPTIEWDAWYTPITPDDVRWLIARVETLEAQLRETGEAR